MCRVQLGKWACWVVCVWAGVASAQQTPPDTWRSSELPLGALAQLKGEIRIADYALIGSFTNQTQDWKVESVRVRLFLPAAKQSIDLTLEITDRRGQAHPLSPSLTGFVHAPLNFMPHPWYWKLMSAKGQVKVDEQQLKSEMKRWQFQY